MVSQVQMKKEKLKSKLKKIFWFFANPHLLLCFGVAWLITNGWSYIMLGMGILFDITWMQTVASAYLAFLWIPITPEKILTVLIAIFLLKCFFPKDKKTLGIMRDMFERIKINHKGHKKKRDEKKRGKRKEIRSKIMHKNANE